jgi:integrase
MASIFKRKRDRNRKGASWYFAYSDENGERRTIKGCTDKAATEQMARKLESEAALRKRGVVDSGLDAFLKHGKCPIEEHICAFGVMLTAKESTAKHVEMTCRFVRVLVGMARIETIRDLAPAGVQAALTQLRADGLAARTVNSYLRGVKSFTKWLVKTGRISADPIAYLSALNEKTDRRVIRRALCPEEGVRLIRAAESGPTILRMNSEDRATLYALIMVTGLRKSEIGSLTPPSFSLESDPPTLTVGAAYSKRRRDDVLPLPAGLASRLRVWLVGKPLDAPVFNLPDKPQKMLYRDLAAAGIEQETASGVIDLHALRHTFVSNVVATGATVKTAQELARHSTPVLTFGVYAHARLADIASTVEHLPDPFKSNRPEAALKTGTDGAQVSGLDSALTAPGQRAGDVSSRLLSFPGGMTESADCSSTSHKPGGSQDLTPPVGSGREKSKARPVGFEPTTFGFEVRDSIR